MRQGISTDGLPSIGRTVGTHGLVRVVGNSELVAHERKQAEANQQRPVIVGLAADLETKWQAAKTAKLSKIQGELLRDLRQRNGEYDPDKLALIKAGGGSDIYMMLTAIKCKTAKAWIKDVLMPADDRAWGAEPTPKPDLPPHIQQQLQQQIAMEAAIAGVVPHPTLIQERMEQLRTQLDELVREEAEKIAERMTTKIDDQLIEGGWSEEFDKFIDDLVTFKAAIIKGPVVRRRKELTWAFEGGRYVPKLDRVLREETYRVSPFDIFPSPDSTGINDGYLFELIPYSRGDLHSMIGVAGYNDEAIRLVLDEYGRGGLREWMFGDQERASLEQRPNELMFDTSKIYGVEYWGSAQGRDLITWGMEGIEDPLAEYQISAIKIGPYVIRAVLNDDPLEDRPYSKAEWTTVPGAFWGKSLPEDLRDIQAMCNAAARALSNNMGMASGPMLGVNQERCMEGEDPTNVYPWRVFRFKRNNTGVAEPPIWFFQPNSNADILLKVYDYFARLADEYTGIPAYSHGGLGDVQGAGSTASGLSMLLGNTAKGIRLVIAHIDISVIRPMITRFYVHNMLYDEDESIKGDLKIVPRGVSALFVKEQQQVRRTEMLTATNNPADLQIMGLDGRAELLRGAFKAADLPTKDIIPELDELRARLKIGQPLGQPDGENPEAPQTLDAAGNPVAGQDHRLF